ncbi:NTP transferase domain-containing protein [Paracoccus panacisoli]|uniref:NTP transferase domain-containing protein n=1 Tax=Paracoccus panacisoli TaxID=1510163 RepID=A0ABV6T1P4_9RHOB
MTAAGACDAGLLLAAGHSRRWGKGDKLLADWRGAPLVAHAAAALAAVPLAHRLAVVRSAEVAAVIAARMPGCRIVTVTGPEMSDSLRAGVAAAAALGVSRLLVTLGDMPEVTPATLHRILSAAGDGAAAAAHGPEARPGPPACLPARLFPAVAGLSGDQGAGGLLARAGARCIAVPGAELADVDVPTP